MTWLIGAGLCALTVLLAGRQVGDKPYTRKDHIASWTTLFSLCGFVLCLFGAVLSQVGWL